MIYIMNELIKKRVNDSLGKNVLIFLKNNFRYEGKLKESDGEFLEIKDKKTNNFQIILISEIKQIEVKDG